ncbi:MAG: hypothetical protein Q9185_004427 [Variospora sp. 1 TL-2023]
MEEFLSKLTWSYPDIRVESAYSTPSPAGHSSDPASPIYPDRPIHPLPRRRLRSRVSPETAESILYNAAPTSAKPLFSLPFNEPVVFVNGSSPDATSDGLASGEFHRQPFSQGRHGYQFKGSDPDSDGEYADDLVRRYQAQQNGSFSDHIYNDQRGAVVKAPKMSLPMSAPSSQDSVDGYDSFENTNNKKKRKIPTSGSLGGHHSSLSAEMASMGISTNRECEVSQAEMDGGIGHYYGSGSSAVPAASSGTGISGAGRGRYGRNVARVPSGRSPLGASTNGSNALQAGRQMLHKQDYTSAGHQSARGKNMAWHEQPPASQAGPTYSHLGNSKPPSDQTINQSRGFATQGTQTSPHTAAGQNQEAPFQGSANQPAPQKPRKPRRSLAKQLTMAARQRRLQQEYDNYHHPPAPEDTWICEFCEYEMIFGSPPEALIRQYELKDRQDRRRLAEKRRLLAKAKMKGRKGKKGTKNAAKNANAANTAQQSAPTPRHELPPDKTSMQNYNTPSEECVAEAYDDDPPPNPAPLPQTPSRIPQPIAHAQHQSLRSATNPAGNADLFTRIGPINSLALRFDRAGRSSGTAFVTYQHLSDARLAIREFDGANAHGQPIRLALLPVAPSHGLRSRAAPIRNPFDTVERPSRSLFDRIDDPRFGNASRSRGGRSRSRSPGMPRRSDVTKPPPEGVDRYVPSPAGRSRVRSRSPRRSRGGDIGGRGRGGRERRGGRAENAGARPRKTQDELDKEMEDYWGPAAGGPGGADTAAIRNSNGLVVDAAPAVVGDEDVDMGVE